MSIAMARGEPLPAEVLAPLVDSTGLEDRAEQLRARFASDGYVHIKGFFDHDDVMAARKAIFERLAEVGEIAQPAIDGIFTGASRRKETVADLGQFWRSVSESWPLRRLSNGIKLHRLMRHLLGEPARAQDYIFLRPAGPGKATHIHCDYPFFTRATEQVATAWIALGDVPVELGPLFIVEGSHRFRDVIEAHRGFDISRDAGRKAAYQATPLELAREKGAKLLVSDFGAGDIAVFSMFLLHGALDNTSHENRVRLSCDVRYQTASADLDPRYFGPNPTGTTGAGYGELVGAKPMTEDWHVR